MESVQSSCKLTNTNREAMANLQLILKYKIQGESEWHVRGAASISLDRGALTLREPLTGASETIPLCRVQGLSIQSLPAAGRWNERHRPVSHTATSDSTIS